MRRENVDTIARVNIERIHEALLHITGEKIKVYTGHFLQRSVTLLHRLNFYVLKQ